MNTTPIPEKLKERFESLANNNVPEFMIPVIVHHMWQAYQLADGESKWIDLNDRLPSDVEASQDLLVVNDGLRMTAEFMKGQWWFDWTNEFLTKVTHWMPLPTLPTPPVK